MLREVDGLSYDEIAYSLGVAVGTVKSRLTRARQTLRARAAGGEDAMKVLTCAAARRRLQAYHDEELPVGEQIEVDAHLEWCDDCAAALEELAGAAVGAARGDARPVVADAAKSSDGFHASVVSRVGAEQHDVVVRCASARCSTTCTSSMPGSARPAPTVVVRRRSC